MQTQCKRRMSSTKITKVGVRATLERMIDGLRIKKNVFSHPLFLFRADDRILRMEVSAMSYLHEEDTYTIHVSWDNNNDDAFCDAMCRFYGVDTDAMYFTIGDIDKDMRFAASGRDAIDTIYDRLTQVLSIELCPCEKCMIPDGEMICLTCCVGVEQEDLKKHMCSICFETCVAPMVCTECCHQHIHKVCKERCGLTCPFCRATTDGYVT